MKILVTAKPKSKKAFVKMITPTEYTVSVHEPAQQGKANKAIISSLAEYFHLKLSQVMIVSGETSRKKVFKIPLEEDQLPQLNQTELKF
jgi:uncharacterized protein (TIGR00251 family)